MAEPLRRRLRARGLELLVRVADAAPEGAVRALLAGAAEAARFAQVERAIRANLHLALGAEATPAELARIARGVRLHAARQLYEWTRLAAGPRNRSWLAERVRCDASIAILEREFAHGRGVIVVTAHLGNWELAAVALRERGFDGVVVGRERERDPTRRFLSDLRRAWGLETVPQDTRARPLLRVLAGGGIVGLLADLEVRRIAGQFLPFFGVPALTMTAPAALARAASLPLVPVRCTLDADGVYRLAVEEPLALDATLAPRRATLELTGRLNAVYERWIRAAPAQWAWHQPRWRTRPGEHVSVPYSERARRSRAGERSAPATLEARWPDVTRS